MPQQRKRRVTLAEFIEQLEAMSAELSQFSAPATVKRSRSKSRQETLKVITELAHQENLTELAGQLEQFFKETFPELLPNPRSLELDELVGWWRRKTEKSDKVGIFWALLLLSSQSKVELFQEEFYQDLKIQVVL